MKHTPGPWKQSPDKGAVIADQPHSGTYTDVENHRAYKGYMIAESIHPENMPIIMLAPALLANLTALVTDLEVLMNNSKGVSGLYKNGRVAPWHDLVNTNGWLDTLRAAKALVLKFPKE